MSVFELTEEGLEAAVAAVHEGHVVVLPTDTVYGVGANPFSEAAVIGLLDAKRRGRDMPPPVLIAEPMMMRALVADVPPAAKELATAFWPGPLTLILRAQKSIGLRLGETRGTVALRVPDHDGARELLRRTGPLAVSSANISGEPPATDVEQAKGQLGESVEVYLDGGPTPGLVPSTIVDFSSDDDGLVIRVGALSPERLREVAASLKLLEPEPDGTPEPEAAPAPEETPMQEAAPSADDDA